MHLKRARSIDALEVEHHHVVVNLGVRQLGDGASSAGESPVCATCVYPSLGVTGLASVLTHVMRDTLADRGGQRNAVALPALYRVARSARKGPVGAAHVAAIASKTKVALVVAFRSDGHPNAGGCGVRNDTILARSWLTPTAHTVALGRANVVAVRKVATVAREQTFVASRSGADCRRVLHAEITFRFLH